MRCSFVALLAVALAIAGCGKAATSPEDVAGPPAALSIVAGDLQADTVGQELQTALVVRVVDDHDRPVQDQIVNFRIIAGGGDVFAGVALTDKDGQARERWTLGTVAGDTQRVEARAVDTQTGQALVFGTFRAVGVPDVAASVVVAPKAAVDSARFIGGDTLLTGDSVGFVAVARDRHGNLKANPPTTWASGDTTVASVTASGVARARAAGAAVVRATVDSVTGSRSFRVDQRTPVALSLVSGGAQSDSVGATLTQPVSVRAVDRRGSGFMGAQVTFRGRNGAPTDTVFACECKVVMTDANGLASTAWVLGVGAGTAILDAVGRPAGGGASFDSLRVTATVRSGAANNMTKVAGGGSATGLVVATRDRYGNPASGVVVSWTVTSGTGSLSNAFTVSDVNGLAGTSVTSATGTVTIEASAPGLTGSPVAFTINATPNFSLDFNSDFVVVPDAPDLDLTTTWTLEAWIKPRDLSVSFKALVSKWGGCSTASYSMELNGAKLRSGIASCQSGTQVVESPDVLVANQWQHVAITLGGGTLRLYVNGVLQATKTNSIAPLNTATALWIGQHTGGGFAFDGLMDEVRIWKVERSAAELAAASSTRLGGTETGLVAYWRFDEGSGDTVFDVTGRGNDGRLGNAVGPDANDPAWTTDAPPITP